MAEIPAGEGRPFIVVLHQHGPHQALRGLRDVHEQIAHEVDPTALPAGSLQHLPNRSLQSRMGIANDQLDAPESPGPPSRGETPPRRPPLR